MNKKYVLISLAVLFAFLFFTGGVNSANEAELETLKNYAITHYGLGALTIEIRDFGCYMSYDHKVCYGSFTDATHEIPPTIWYDVNSSKFYDQKITFHQMHPEFSEKIDRELYIYIKENAIPDQERIQIWIISSEKVTDAQLHQLNETGIHLFPLSYNKSLSGYNPYWVFGNATPLQIEQITKFDWDFKILLNEPRTGALDIIEEPTPSDALIISNSIDKPAAERLANFLEKNNIISKIINASIDSSILSYDLVFVLGGPQAYEGVGEIVSQYLSESEKDYLINKNGSFDYWVRSSNWINNQQVIIIAGHTRNETALAELEFENNGLTEEGWLIV